jgi:hypothetical protein
VPRPPDEVRSDADAGDDRPPPAKDSKARASEREQIRAEMRRRQKAGEPAARTTDKAPRAKAAGASSPKGTKGKAKRRSPAGARVRRLRGRARKLARRRLKLLRRRWKRTKRSARRTVDRRHRGSYRSTIMRVPSRDEIPALLNARGLVGRGAEIGVKTGTYSDFLLSNWKGSELISIDPWLSADADEYVDRSNVSQDEFEQYYQATRQRLSRHGSRSAIWRMTSVEAAAQVPDASLDFVYIDARHDYDSVLEDLDAWCSKVRPGGIIAGHDYVDGNLPQGDFFVKSAVDEFFGARGIPVRGTDGPTAVEMFPSWIVVAPEGGIPVTPAAKTTPG